MTTTTPETISSQDAAAEIMRRRAARGSLIQFAQYVRAGYIVDPMHQLIADTLDQVVEGKINRLMIYAPPQTGKTELTSVIFPCYWLAKHPNSPVILASYAADLALSKSRDARQIVESYEYQLLFGTKSGSANPIDTSKDSRAVDDWRLVAPHRGGMRAVGVGGGLTGFPGGIGILDDPIKGWKEAQSKVVREAAWDWYRSVFRTRMWEGAPIIIIMTRWNQADVAGKLIDSAPGDWHVLRIAALAETQEERDKSNKLLSLPEGLPDPLGRQPGESASPSRFSVAALEATRTDVGSLMWGSMYMGVPRNAEGNRFKRDWFEGDGHIVPPLPPHVRDIRRVRYWDKAGTEGSGKFTAGVLLAYFEGRLYIEHIVRGQWSAFNRERIMKETAERDALLYGKSGVEIWIEQEPGSGGKESAEATIRNLMGFRIRKDLPTGSKDARLEPFAAQAEAGNVYLVRGLWNADFVDEMLAIPNGTYRDQADAVAGAFNMLFSSRKSNTGRQYKHDLWKSNKKTSGP